jgi:hypothetical protein
VLYKTPKGSRFLCRDCYKLTYLSCQQSHQWDRGRFATLGAMQETSQRIDKLRARLRRKRPGSKAHKRIWKRLSELYRVYQQQKAAAEASSGLMFAKIENRIKRAGKWYRRKQSTSP